MQPDTEAAITADLLTHLRSWEGRTDVQQDDLTISPMRRLAATLDCETVAASSSAELPALWHWLYFLPQAPQRELGDDGHPRRGGFLPPVPLPRRMWAGGRLQWHAALRAGDRLRRVSRIVSVAHKAGRSGELVFVLVRHEFSRDGTLLLTEEQDLVYRAPPRSEETARPAPVADTAPPEQAASAPATWSRTIVPDPVLLFRYSALTFNSHRIHYDRPYATGEEGYPGLVVHGPLIATLLADLARRATPEARVTGFSFKALRPAIDRNPLRLCGEPAADGKSAQLRAEDHEGRVAMQGRIEFD
ncbi:MAG: MaoC family dehydratase N-terminal domain-containing protein [Lautropia sp.]